MARHHTFQPTTRRVYHSDLGLFAHVVGYPAEGLIRVRAVPSCAPNVTVLATGELLAFDQHGGVLEQGLLRITLPSASRDSLNPVIKVGF